MLSECARATTAAEQRFRISAPVSRPRVVTVIALDEASETAIQALDRSPWPAAGFFTAATFKAQPAPQFSLAHWLSDLAGRTKDLITEVLRSDLVVMIAAGGAKAEAAAVIGETCHLHHVTTAALVLGVAAGDGAAARTLAHLRPHADMLVAAASPAEVADLLTALRA